MTVYYNLYLKACMEVETVFNSHSLVYDEEKATKNVINNIEKLRSSTSFLTTPIESKNRQGSFSFSQ